MYEHYKRLEENAYLTKKEMAVELGVSVDVIQRLEREITNEVS